MPKKVFIKVGAAWKRAGENDRGKYEFFSIQTTGKSEKDDYEIILRRKSDGFEEALWKFGVAMSKNKYKSTDANSKQPDYILTASYEEGD